MKIEWLGHASFLFTLDSGKKICTDPYESGSYEGAVGYEPINEEVDLVTVSHQHEDHNCIDELKGDFEVIDKPGEYEKPGIKILGFKSFHDTSAGAERGKNIIFKIIADGLNIVHFGDLGHDLSERDVKDLGAVDIALIPVGGHFTIDSEVAWRIINKIDPSIVIPMHYKTEKLGFPIAGVGEFLSSTENVGHREELNTVPGDLPKDTLVIVLNHKR